MASPTPVTDLDPSAPFATAARQALLIRARELAIDRDAVVATADIEPLHDLRVATRRLRSAIELFAPCLPELEREGVLREVKLLADHLGRRRDRDVAIASLGQLRLQLTPAGEASLEPLLTVLGSEQETAAGVLERVLVPGYLERLVQRVEALAGAAGADV